MLSFEYYTKDVTVSISEYIIQSEYHECKYKENLHYLNQSALAVGCAS